MRPSLKVVSIVCAWWTAYAFVAAGQQVEMATDLGKALPWSDAIVGSLAGYWFWVPLTLGVLWWVARCPLERGRVLLWLVQMLVAVSALVVLRAAYVYATNPWFEWYDRLPSFAAVVARSLSNNFLLSWLVIGAAHAFVLYDRTHRHRVQVAELEASLAAARLEALAAQLNPHFLFNALNAVAELVHHDVEAADRMLVGLSELLRQSLSHAQDHEVRLSEELALLRQYCDIQQLRMGERLRVQWAVADECLGALVPVLILQPLVENAITHGIATREAAGCVGVQARVEGRQLVIEITDEGASEGRAIRGHGLGLPNTRARLQCLHGEAATLEVSARDGGGTRARLALPFRVHPTTAPRLATA